MINSKILSINPLKGIKFRVYIFVYLCIISYNYLILIILTGDAIVYEIISLERSHKIYFAILTRYLFVYDTDQNSRWSYNPNCSFSELGRSYIGKTTLAYYDDYYCLNSDTNHCHEVAR